MQCFGHRSFGKHYQPIGIGHEPPHERGAGHPFTSPRIDEVQWRRHRHNAKVYQPIKFTWLATTVYSLTETRNFFFSTPFVFDPARLAW